MRPHLGNYSIPILCVLSPPPSQILKIDDANSEIMKKKLFRILYSKIEIGLEGKIPGARKKVPFSLRGLIKGEKQKKFFTMQSFIYCNVHTSFFWSTSCIQVETIFVHSNSAVSKSKIENINKSTSSLCSFSKLIHH